MASKNVLTLHSFWSYFRSFRLLISCRKNQKTRTQSLNPLSFGSFCTTVMTQKPNARQALGKVLSARSPIAIYRALICLKETSSQGKKVRIINVFQTCYPRKASYDKKSLGEHSCLVAISYSPVLSA